MRQFITSVVGWNRQVRGRTTGRAKRELAGKRLAVESLEARAMLANAAPVAVNDSYTFYGWVEHNIRTGLNAPTYIAAGSEWYSSTDGSDQNLLNPKWKADVDAGFDPASGNEVGWSAEPQPAKFGFGDGNEVTPVPPGSTTYYFFRPFDISGSMPTTVRLGLLVDDCAVVHLNGVEVFRSANFAPGPIGHDTYCTTGRSSPEESQFTEFKLQYLRLRETGNVIAVEVHQATAQSSDLGFDLSLASADGGLLANDFDPDDPREDLRVELVDVSQVHNKGTLVVTPSGEVTFSPHHYQIGGSFSFTYRIVDDGDPTPPAQVSNVATVNIQMPICDCGPVIARDDIDVPQFVTNEDTELVIDAESGPVGPYGIGVVANDLHPSWGTLFARVISPPASGGTVQFISGTGGFIYRPKAGFSGIDSFQYVANTGFDDSNISTVEITVLSVDDPPMAVFDRYRVQIDSLLATASRMTLIPRGSTWWYLDELTSESPLEGYPSDADSSSWNSPSFDVATSNPAIGAWKSGRGPFAQPLNGLQHVEAQSLLAGVSFRNTTYLFRREFDLSAEDVAAISTLWADMVFDDGVAVSINGVEVGRFNMPDGPLETTTFANSSIPTNYERYSLYPLTIPAGLLRTGGNTIAVELHSPNIVSSDAGFDLSLYALPAGVSDSGVLSNDFDADGETIQNAAVVPGTGPAHGRLVEFRTDGSFVYEPDEDFSGVDTFQYMVMSNGETSSPAIVYITVVESPALPDGANDDVYRVPYYYQFPLVTTAANGALANDLSDDGPLRVLIEDPLATTVMLDSGKFTWLNLSDFDGWIVSDGSFRFEPTSSVFPATIALDYTTIDAAWNVDSAKVTITVGVDQRMDLDGNGFLDLFDMAILIAHFGMTSGANNSLGDINQDGRVNLADATLLRNSISETPMAAAAVVAQAKAATSRGVAIDQYLEAVHGREASVEAVGRRALRMRVTPRTESSPIRNVLSSFEGASADFLEIPRRASRVRTITRK